MYPRKRKEGGKHPSRMPTHLNMRTPYNSQQEIIQTHVYPGEGEEGGGDRKKLTTSGAFPAMTRADRRAELCTAGLLSTRASLICRSMDASMLDCERVGGERERERESESVCMCWSTSGVCQTTHECLPRERSTCAVCVLMSELCVQTHETHISDATQDTDGVASIHVHGTPHILEQRIHNDKGIFGKGGQFLQHQVHHAPQRFLRGFVWCIFTHCHCKHIHKHACICSYIYTHQYVHTYIHAYIHSQTCTHTHTHTRVPILLHRRRRVTTARPHTQHHPSMATQFTCLSSAHRNIAWKP